MKHVSTDQDKDKIGTNRPRADNRHISREAHHVYPEAIEIFVEDNQGTNVVVCPTTTSDRVIVRTLLRFLSGC